MPYPAAAWLAAPPSLHKLPRRLQHCYSALAQVDQEKGLGGNEYDTTSQGLSPLFPFLSLAKKIVQLSL